MFLNCSKKLKKTNIITFALLLCFSMFGLAQISVTGLVTDNTNQPLPSASVVVKGTNTGVQTDFDGNFSIKVSKGDVLVVSYLGFATKEITIGDESTLKIILIEDADSLDEIVVVGYGTKSKSKLIAAVSTINEKTYTIITNRRT